MPPAQTEVKLMTYMPTIHSPNRFPDERSLIHTRRDKLSYREHLTFGVPLWQERSQ